MGFWLKRYARAVVLLCGCGLGGANAQTPQVTVLVYDRAGVGHRMLEEAGSEAARIYRNAGIRLEWINCLGGSSLDRQKCHAVSRPNELILQVIHKGKASSDNVFGVAFLGSDERGKYADVFFDRMLETHQRLDIDTAHLLGVVAAHEIGHLLLGAGAHSWTGVMAPVWNTEFLTRIEMGALFFNSSQASAMKERIGREELKLAGSESGPEQ